MNGSDIFAVKWIFQYFQALGLYSFIENKFYRVFYHVLVICGIFINYFLYFFITMFNQENEEWTMTLAAEVLECE